MGAHMTLVMAAMLEDRAARVTKLARFIVFQLGTYRTDDLGANCLRRYECVKCLNATYVLKPLA